MRASNVTLHAEKRLTERSRLSPDKLKTLLDNGATVPVATQRGGRFAQRLVYSSLDENWFIVVQDADDGGVLTVMPLGYLKGRLFVTAAQKRSARKRVRVLENPPRLQPNPIRKTQVTTTASGADASLVPSNSSTSQPRDGWKIRLCCTINGLTSYRNLPSTTPGHGGPEAWTEPGPIHDWLRERLIEADVPFKAVERLHAARKGLLQCVDFLLEHLPMTPDEIAACR